MIVKTEKELREKCPKFDFDNPLVDPLELKKELIEAMFDYAGLGVSANQIGYKHSVFAMNHEGNNMVLFNPQIIEESTEYVWEMEGCLTYPGLFIKISRPKSLAASWEDAENKNLTGYFSDLSARIFLHEMDHIKGKVFYEGASKLHLSNARRKRRSQLNSR